MNNQQDNLPELIDCCRPQAGDLQLPELQPLAAAIQTDPQVDRRLNKSHRIDALIGQSLRDVSIPAGLEERLLVALSSSQPRSTGIDAAVDFDRANQIDTINEVNAGDHGVAEINVIPIASRGVIRNRWKVWLSAAAGVAAVLVITFLVFHESVPSLATPRDVANQSSQWLAGLIESEWAYDRFPDQEFPLPQQQGFRQLYRWQLVASTSPSLKVLCYNISPPQPATHLFVCLGSHSSALPPTPPAMPYTLKPGWLGGGWQSDGVVYVLAVQGTAQRYHQVRNRQNQYVASTARLPARS